MYPHRAFISARKTTKQSLFFSLSLSLLLCCPFCKKKKYYTKVSLTHTEHKTHEFEQRKKTHLTLLFCCYFFLHKNVCWFVWLIFDVVVFFQMNLAFVTVWCHSKERNQSPIYTWSLIEKLFTQVIFYDDEWWNERKKCWSNALLCVSFYFHENVFLQCWVFFNDQLFSKWTIQF